MEKAKIYTRTGDKGLCSIISGKRVSKGSLQLEAYGDLDELSSCLGWLGSLVSDEWGMPIRKIQNTLFTCGSIAASDMDQQITFSLPKEGVAWLESQIDTISSSLPPLKSFILPGGNSSAAAGHIARTVCRRAERKMVALYEQNPLSEFEEVIRYLNRLSDYLFVLARKLNNESGNSDFLWDKDCF